MNTWREAIAAANKMLSVVPRVSRGGVSNRRLADVADRGLGRLSWADCGPTSSRWE
jgi:hypothetical protein